MINSVVNLIIVLFCMIYAAKMFFDFRRASGDDRIAQLIIISITAAMLICNGIYIMIVSEDKILEMWVNAFLAFILSFLLQKIYYMLKDCINPVKSFVRILIPVFVIYVAIEIFF